MNLVIKFSFIVLIFYKLKVDAARLRRNSVDKLEKENFDLNEKLKEVEEEKVIVEEMYLKLNEQLTSKEAENDILSQSLQKVKIQLGTLESLIQKLKLENEQINLSKAELLETDSKFQTLELTLQHANQVIKEMKKEVFIKFSLHNNIIFYQILTKRMKH